MESINKHGNGTGADRKKETVDHVIHSKGKGEAILASLEVVVFAKEKNAKAKNRFPDVNVTKVTSVNEKEICKEATPVFGAKSIPACTFVGEPVTGSRNGLVDNCLALKAKTVKLPRTGEAETINE